MAKYLAYILISLLLVFIQQSVLPAFHIFSGLNLLLIVIIFVDIIFGFDEALALAIFLGLVAGFYSFLPFGTLLLIFPLVLSAINFMQKNVLINFSFFSSIILMLLAVLLYDLLLVTISYICYWSGLIKTYVFFDNDSFRIFLSQCVWSILLMSILIIFAKATIKRFNLAFLQKR